MREIRPSGSEGGHRTTGSPYPYPQFQNESTAEILRFAQNDMQLPTAHLPTAHLPTANAFAIIGGLELRPRERTHHASP